MSHTDTADLLGIGFGPSNLALAIAAEELNTERTERGERQLDVRFVESQPQFSWHDGMLLPGTTMQVSFLKDLATLRNPQSDYTFLNYLQKRGRLSDFINLKTFFPTRLEFHDYLTWAADQITAPVTYGARVTRVDWTGTHFDVQVEGSPGPLQARALALGLGIEPVLPAGVSPSDRVFHSHRLLDVLDRVPSRRHGRYVVVGAGQSAAEVAAYLHEVEPMCEVHISHRRFGYSPSDDTPYVNQIFDPESVNHFYGAPADARQRLLTYHAQTNYAAVDAELIETLYRREYSEKVEGRRRIMLHRVTEVDSLDDRPDGVTVGLRDLASGTTRTIEADAVVFATGFRPRHPERLLGPSVRMAVKPGQDPVERDYRLRLEDGVGGVYLNGGVEPTHGLSSSLLSNVAVRAADILTSVIRAEQRLPV